MNHQNELSRKSKKILSERVGKLGIRFGTRRGAGDLNMLLSILVEMAATKKCAPATVRKLKRESKAVEKKLGAEAIILSED